MSLPLSRDTLGRSCIPWKWSASARAKGPSTTGMPSKRRLDIAVERVSIEAVYWKGTQFPWMWRHTKRSEISAVLWLTCRCLVRQHTFWIANLSSICRCIRYCLKCLNFDGEYAKQCTSPIQHEERLLNLNLGSFCHAIPAWYSVFIDIKYVVRTLYACLQGQALSILMQTAAWTRTISKNAISWQPANATQIIW